MSLKSRIVLLMLLCWLIPLLVLAGANLRYLSGDHLENLIFKEVDRLKFSDENTIHQLEKVEELSLQPSYDGELLDFYDDYRNREISGQTLMALSSSYLKKYYSREDTVDLAALWYRDRPDRFTCDTYNTAAGEGYSDVLTFWQEDFDKINEAAESLGTRWKLIQMEDRLYFVRNLCSTDYRPVATLVLRINRKVCFEAYSTFPDDTSVTLILNGCTVAAQGAPVTPEETGVTDMGGRSGYIWKNGILRLYHNRQMGNSTFISLARIERSAAFSPFRGYRFLFIETVLCLIPLMMLLLTMLHRYISQPIDDMMEGAKEIEQGNLGYQLPVSDQSTEFRYLTDSFNSMSSRLKYQFQHIYEEELALRDARIKALQSHINPHFMNNTLEIINWEARLSGNDKVSRMIEALATLMNAGIDRHQMPEIPLSEEMIYVDAYLYIISQRLGDRLTVLNEFPEEIMSCSVPRLILQPVIENAIEHGVVRNGRGTVMLYGYQKEDFLYLEIMNDSVMTADDRKKVEKLLDPNYDTTRESSLNLGISNVNQRLRILYGPESGLSVEQVDPRHVCARLTIHLKTDK